MSDGRGYLCRKGIEWSHMSFTVDAYGRHLSSREWNLLSKAQHDNVNRSDAGAFGSH